MGTASFAVPVLDRLVKNGYAVVAVVTAPDKPAGRGKKIRYSPIKDYAIENKLNILQPEKLKDASFIQMLLELKPDLQVVVAFRMLPVEVWKIPPLGTINLHASLLPQFRGAAPINHAIIQGSKTSGVTTFLIDDTIDTGQILKQSETPILENETAGELHDRLMVLGADLTLATVQELVKGTHIPIAQEALIPENETLHTAPKIFKEDCRINWDQDVHILHNFIRGLSPLPGAYTYMNFKEGNPKVLKVFSSKIINAETKSSPGSIIFTKHTLEIACSNGYLSLGEVQLEGKRKMPANDFLRGFNVDSSTGLS